MRRPYNVCLLVAVANRRTFDNNGAEEMFATRQFVRNTLSPDPTGEPTGGC